ncbi:DNA cytosine methyltransferase [Microcoleus vaginatus DQ-U2]|uniref:DNA cytosine methyltransferase n=1 Tax=Microcoleus vaginatus TaxID=119532 RepID=UPI0016889FEB|nr:DNA cytosine methyltransferase [Microcoleus sp. FACHB-DQ6]
MKYHRDKALTSLELFAGAGGLALGVHAAGFQLVGLVEQDKFAVETLRHNSQEILGLNPDLVLHCDARKVDYKQFVSVDLLSAGPPCQPFSTAGRSVGKDDPRNMFPVFVDAVALLMPKAILVENVKGLLREKFRDYFNYILKCIEFPLYKIREGEDWLNHYQRLQKIKKNEILTCEQYNVAFQVVDTADFGIPQRRERVVITAFRRDLGIEAFTLKETHSKEALLIDQWITRTYWKRHHVSPHDYLGPKDKKILNQLQNKSPLININERLPWRTVRDVVSNLPEPVDRGCQENFLNHVQHPGARTYKCHIGSFYDYPAKALKAGTNGTPGGENIVRMPPDDAVRYFTTRESARLHTFPDKWRFYGTWGACIRQLGNAVPVDMATLFAKEIYQRLINVE